MTKYIIVPTAVLTEAHIEECDQNSLSTVRRSLDGSLSIVSSVSLPKELASYPTLTAVQAAKAMQSKEWNPLATTRAQRVRRFITRIFGV